MIVALLILIIVILLGGADLLFLLGLLAVAAAVVGFVLLIVFAVVGELPQAAISWILLIVMGCWSVTAVVHQIRHYRTKRSRPDGEPLVGRNSRGRFTRLTR